MRGARVRIIELRNDLKANTDDLAKALEKVYAQPSGGEEAQNVGNTSLPVHPNHDNGPQRGLPFAKINGVAPGSPAAEAVRHILIFIVLQISEKITRDYKERI